VTVARVKALTKALLMMTSALLVFAQPAFACPVCFGAPDSPQVRGMQMGILALLGVTVAVLGAFAGFFLYLRRRQKVYGGSY
jgi:hypothetical protein